MNVIGEGRRAGWQWRRRVTAQCSDNTCPLRDQVTWHIADRVSCPSGRARRTIGSILVPARRKGRDRRHRDTWHPVRITRRSFCRYRDAFRCVTRALQDRNPFAYKSFISLVRSSSLWGVARLLLRPALRLLLSTNILRPKKTTRVATRALRSELFADAACSERNGGRAFWAGDHSLGPCCPL